MIARFFLGAENLVIYNVLGTFSKNRGVRKHTQKSETWLSWNGKRVNGESCKHVKKKQEPREQQHDQEPEREHQEEQQRKSGKNSESIQLASQTFAWSFAGALRAPAQRFEVGSPGASLARARTAPEKTRTETSVSVASRCLEMRRKSCPNRSRKPP